MGGTVEMLVQDLAPLDAAARAQRVRELDERFAYPVLLLDAAGVQALDTAARERLARGELVVRGLNRKVLAPLPGDGQVLELGPLDPDWNPEHRLNLPRALWLQLAAALALALTVGLLAWWLLRPAWRDLRALRRAADALAAGRFDAPLPALRSRLFAPLGRGMRATLERLAGALAAQRELTGAVSHELRTPLARLRFGIDALVDEDDRAARERAVAACERDIEELDALIDASLTLARLDMGALRAAPQPGDLAALLAQEAAGFAPLRGTPARASSCGPGPSRPPARRRRRSALRWMTTAPASRPRSARRCSRRSGGSTRRPSAPAAATDSGWRSCGGSSSRTAVARSWNSRRWAGRGCA
jgi:two-component system sensor histidine kinase RstB